MKRVSDFLEILCDRTEVHTLHTLLLERMIIVTQILNKSKIWTIINLSLMKITVWQLWIKLLHKSLDRFFCESKFPFLLGMSENTRSHSKCMLNCVSNYQIFSKVHDYLEFSSAIYKTCNCSTSLLRVNTLLLL